VLTDILYIVIGFALLAWGADLMVSGASQLARSWGISPLVVGLTIVAFGTSAPELAVSLSASFSGKSAIAIGNVVGSNIGNIGLALGIAALIRPLSVQVRLVRFEVPILMGASGIIYFFAWMGEIQQWFGYLLITGLFAYIFFLYRWAFKEGPEVEAEYAVELRGQKSPLINLVKVCVGFACLAGGGHILVDGASGLARAFGISELVIGLTILALGTSLPEIITSIIAVWRKQVDIAIGNVLGSNLFNTLGVLGAAAAVQPIPIERDLLVRDFPVLSLMTLLLFPFLRTGYRVRWWEGMLFVMIYVAYIGIIIMGHLS